MKINLKITLFINCICLVFIATAQNKNVLTANEFEKAIITDTVQILDVRTPEEYAQGHIKNTLLANWNDKAEFLRRISFINKSKPVYVYCLAGGRSAAAAKQLREDGFESVFELKGGINEWKANNKLLENAINVKQKTIEEYNKDIKSTKLVLVDFGATWCPPCKKMEPILNKLKNNKLLKFSLLKVDGGKDVTILKEMNVKSLPVFIIYKNGKQIWRKDGIVDENELKNHLK